MSKLEVDRREFIKLSAAAAGSALVISACGNTLDTVKSQSCKAEETKIRGFNFPSWKQGEYASGSSDKSLKNLADTGANWVALVVTAYQNNISDTTIDRQSSKTVTDGDLSHAIATSKRLGLRVMLKPHLDLFNDGIDRRTIGVKFQSDDEWKRWFDSYNSYIAHCADIAKQEGVDQFCVGTELKATALQEKNWREVISNTRVHFPGPLVYAANFYQEYSVINWWDALDSIGIDAYFDLTKTTNPSVEEIKDAWVNQGHVNSMEAVATKFSKQVIFTEIGYRSVDGANIHPWDWKSDAKVNQDEQANCYRAAISLFYQKPWFAGALWWDWLTDPSAGGPNDSGYTPYRKKAKDVFRTVC